MQALLGRCRAPAAHLFRGAAASPAAEALGYAPVASASGLGEAVSATPAFGLQQLRWASKKQGGSTQNGRESQPKNLGCKLFDNQRCSPGNIIVRQRGTRFLPGDNTGMGRDHTIFSKVEGFVCFHTDKRTKRRTISVTKLEEVATSLHLRANAAGP